MVGSRLLLIPVIAAVGYEILKFGARHRANPLVKVLHVPRHPRPDDHDEAARRRHDRGRDRVDGGALEADGNEVPAAAPTSSGRRCGSAAGPTNAPTREPVPRPPRRRGAGEPPTAA